MSNLTEYTLAQLKQLQSRISKELTRREIDKKTALLKRLRKLARDEGVELEELLSTTGQAKGPKSPKKSEAGTSMKAPLPIKYRNPSNLEQGWSGRGRKPGWFEAWVNNGGSVDALKNAARINGRNKSVA